MPKPIKPWWDRVNDYYLLDERKEFARGAIGFRPNNKQDAMIAQISAGYVNNVFAAPKSHAGKR
jgi:hypothetical protein